MTSEPSPNLSQLAPPEATPGHESLGQYLVQARRQRNLSREEVAAATGISLKTMSALEEDRHDQLPAKVFVRGLIKIYAKELRIPAAEPLALLDRQENEGDADHHSLDRTDVSELAVSSPMLTSKKILILIILLLGSLAIYYGFGPATDLLWKPAETGEHHLVETPPAKPENAAPVATPPSPAPVVESKTTPAAVSTPPKSEPAASTPSPAPEIQPNSVSATAKVDPAPPAIPVATGEYPYVLKAEFIEKTWVKTSVDGQAAVSRTYQPKEEKVWQAKNSITIHLGNAGGATLTLNGEPITHQGKSGQALKLRFPLDVAP